MMPERDRVSRVLMTADTVGGVWSYALQLATLLAGRGVEVVLATMGRQPTEAQRQEAAAVPALKLQISSFALEWMPDPWDDVERAGLWLLDLERGVEPDVVHLNGFAHGALPFRAPPVVVAHSCVSSWWNAVKREPLPREWSRYVDTVRTGLASASRIVAPSRAMRDALVRCYGVGHDAVVIPHARAIERGRRQQKEPLVLAAGHAWDPAKNIATLDRAANGLPWPVKVAGEVSTRHRRGETLTHVVALGKQTPEEMADLMGRAAIFAHPARYEPFGLSVLEAALSECALVLGDIDTLRENWSGAARFVSPDDDTALRGTMLELISRPAEREALAAAGLRRAELFSPQQHRDRYYDLYQATIDQRRRTGATRPTAAPSSSGSRL
jgi:glycosyltransferase involved in cell wall biosynthesis